MKHIIERYNNFRESQKTLRKKVREQILESYPDAKKIKFHWFKYNVKCWISFETGDEKK